MNIFNKKNAVLFFALSLCVLITSLFFILNIYISSALINIGILFLVSLLFIFMFIFLYKIINKKQKELALLTSNYNDIQNNLSRKEELFAIASHDLRTPFNSILGFTELLLIEDNLDAMQKKYIKLIRNSAQTQLNYVNGLLYMIRTGKNEIKLRFKKFDLCKIVKTTVNEIEILAKQKDIEILLAEECQGETLLIRADKEKIIQVLYNLFSNALKFTPAGGKIIIKALKIDELIEFHVIDDGIGIDPDMQDEIFNSFEKLGTGGTRGEKGTGLGLSICKNIIEKHNGTIQVKSELTKGSDFYFTIPIDAENKNS